MSHRIGRRAALALPATAPGLAVAQAWPARPVRILVPFAPGGTTDVHARLIAESAGRALGQTVLVENLPGNSGNVGAQYVVRQAPDGHLFLMGGSTHTTNASLFRNPGYSLERDLVAVAVGPFGGNVLVVGAGSPLRSLAEWLAWARAAPRSFANPGAGTSNHLAMELLAARAGVQLDGIPYRGAAPALTDVLAGHVPTMFINVELALDHARAGRLRMLAISSAAPSPAAPEVPTISSQGFEGFDTGNFTALWARAGTPVAALERMNALANATFAEPATAARLREQGMAFQPRGLEEAGRYLAAEAARAAQVVEAARIERQ